MLNTYMKICCTCKENKNLNDFCKNKNNKDGLDRRCRDCHSKCHFKFREKRIKKSKDYNLKNREKLLAKKREYTALHREEKAKYDLIYRSKNKEKARKYKKQWAIIRRAVNPLFRIKNNLRRRLSHALKGNLKADKTLNLLGCDIYYFKRYLENKFILGMTWENYGKEWHIDHIIPCSKFDLSKQEEQKKCFHYLNMQPLWAIDNLKKARRILNDYQSCILPNPFYISLLV